MAYPCDTGFVVCPVCDNCPVKPLKNIHSSVVLFRIELHRPRSGGPAFCINKQVPLRVRRAAYGFNSAWCHSPFNYIKSAHARPCEKDLHCLIVCAGFRLTYHSPWISIAKQSFLKVFIGPDYGRVVMVEKTLIGIIALVFLISSWWWSDRQNATENFYENQLRERDTVITQLRTLALPQLKAKTPEQVQVLFKTLYPEYEVRLEDNAVYAGVLSVRFSEDGAAEGLSLPWDAIKQTPLQ
jgi:hypothetical protein